MHKNSTEQYGLYSLLWMFFIFSFVGWTWEALLYLLYGYSMVNRGFLFGPWLPIYGCGSILILFFLEFLKPHPFYLFLGAALICGMLEYSTSWALEHFAGARWWDYRDNFLNIHGRVCLISLLVFGIAGFLVSYYAAPRLNSCILKCPLRLRKMIAVFLLVLFSIDLIYSIKNPHTGENITFPV